MSSRELKNKAYIISDWEASSRYNDDFTVVKSEIESAISLYENLKQTILQRQESESDKEEKEEKEEYAG